MAYFLFITLTALIMLIGLSTSAFAGTIAVPEPGTLALLATGVGGIAAIRYFRRK